MVPPLSDTGFYLLLSLAENPRHGYAILKDVEILSRGDVVLSVSTLYTSLSRLLAQGLIERFEDGDGLDAPGLPRKSYQLTSNGRAALRVSAGRMRNMLQAIQLRLGPDDHP